MLITIQETQNGFYAKVEYQDGNDFTEDVIHYTASSFRELIAVLAEVCEEDVTLDSQILKLIKKEDK